MCTVVEVAGVVGVSGEVGEAGVEDGAGVEEGEGAEDEAAGVAVSTDGGVKLANAAISLSSSTVTAIGVPQGMSEEPAGTRIFAKNASSCASKSMVALSVSISAIMSPAEMDSPCCLTHFATPPNSIVGERAGMGRISWGGNSLNRGKVRAVKQRESSWECVEAGRSDRWSRENIACAFLANLWMPGM